LEKENQLKVMQDFDLLQLSQDCKVFQAGTKSFIKKWMKISEKSMLYF
jgi:hypothetical protein